MECDEDGSGCMPVSDRDEYTLEPPCLLEQAGEIVIDAHAQEKQESSADGDENESAEVTQDSAAEDEEDEQVPLSYELQEGWKILDYFLRKVDSSLTFHFKDAVDSSFPDTLDYYEKVKEPIWLNLMRDKFEKREYNSITEFVTDFRRMVYNCCSFNGTSHHLSKKAEKLLYMLTQKLNLLRHDIRQKTTEDVTTPWLQKQDNNDSIFSISQRKRNSAYRRDTSSEMRRQLRQEEEEKARAARKQKKEDKFAADMAAQQDMLEWEDKHLTVGAIKTIIRHSWELPQVGMFLHLCRDLLNLEEVPFFELERCLAMPRQSSRLQKIMTSLLSTPHQRERLTASKVMHYDVWTSKLTQRLDLWYKTLANCDGNVSRAACELGIEERFFEILGLTNPMHEKAFHNLDFYKKIWILKSICENLVDKDGDLAKAIENTQYQSDQREVVEGVDRHGNSYIFFSQFCGEFLRVYRHRKYADPSLKDDSKEGDGEEKKPAKRGSAKKQLNLNGTGGNQSQCSTPVDDSEVESTASPAPSEAKSKSRASSSRHSSPMLNDSNVHSRQASARSSPSLDCSSQDSFPKQGRRTRNSAESTFFNGNLDQLLRLKSRRGRGSKKTGDPITQDVSSAESSSSPWAGVGDADKASEKEGKSEAHPAGDGSLHSMNVPGSELSLLADVSAAVCMKTETDHLPCDSDGAIQDNKLIRDCDIKTEPCPEEKSSTIPAVNTVSSQKSQSIDQDSSLACDNSSVTNKVPSIQSSSSCDTSARNNLNSSASIKTEPTADDSGFVSSDHVSPPRYENGHSSATNLLGDEKNNDVSSDSNSTEDLLRNYIDRTKKMPTSNKNGDDGSSIAVKEESTCSDNAGKAGCQSTDAGEGQIRVASTALVDHDVYTGEELMPDLGEFELLVEDMEGLDTLIQKFAPDESERSQQESPGARSSKRQVKTKTPQKTPKRWACEEELYLNLCRLKGELETHKARSKLPRFRQKYYNKMRNEYQEFVEEEAQPQDSKEWESESEENTEESAASDVSSVKEDSDSSQLPNSSQALPSQNSTANEKKAQSRAALQNDRTEGVDSDHRGIEEYEMDVSSRGRLRKRRVIPNGEQTDQGPRKKRIKKEEEEEIGGEGVGMNKTSTAAVTDHHAPVIVQKPQGGGAPATIVSLVKGVAGNEHLVQQLAATSKRLGAGQTVVLGPRGLQVIRSASPATAVTPGGGSASAQSKSFPVMQKILSGAGGQVSPLHAVEGSRAQAHPQRINIVKTSLACTTPGRVSKTVAVAIATTTSTASSSVGPVAGTISRAPGAGELGVRGSHFVMTGAGDRHQVIHLKLQEELIKKGILQYQVHGQAGQTASATPQTPAVTSATAQLTSTTSTTTRQILTSQGQVIAPVGQMLTSQGQILAQQGQRQVLITAAPRPTASGHGVAGVTPAGQVITPAGQVITPAKVQEILGVPASGHVLSPVKLQVGGIGGKAPVIVNNSSGSKTLVVMGHPAHKVTSSRYGNVTVKRLLEDRQACKTEDTDGNTSATTPESSQTITFRALQHGTVVVTSSSPTSAISASPVVVSTIPQQRVVPATLRVPSQSALDSALQSVVTGYHTTLPTADIKVPSPTTLPSLSPRRNVTRTVQSNKSPIFTTSKVQTEKKLVTTIVSSGAGLTFDPTATGVVLGTSSSAPAGMTAGRQSSVVLPVRQGLASVDSATGKKQFVVQLISPGAGTAGVGNTQRIMLPQGTVLASLKTTQALGTSTLDAASLQLLGNQPVLSVPVSNVPNSGGDSGLQVQGNPTNQGLLVTVPTPSGSSTTSTTPGTPSKVTSDVLKSMLAAKVEGTASASTPASSVQLLSLSSTTGTGTISTPSSSTTSVAASTGAAVKVIALPGGPRSNGSQLQTRRIVKAPDIAGLTVAVPGNHGGVAVHGNHLALLRPQQQQGVANSNIGKEHGHPVGSKNGQQPSSVAGGVEISGSVTSQGGPPRQNIVRVSLPAGAQLAGLPAGVSGIRLLATGQPGTGSSTGQPIVATIKPGAQGLQQLQVLAAAGGLQGMRMQLLSQLHQQQQQRTVSVDGSGQIVGGLQPPQQQRSVQLCYNVQPNRQAVVDSNTLASATETSAASATVSPQGLGTVQKSASLHTPAAAGKVIRASLTAPAANPVTLQLSTAPAISSNTSSPLHNVSLLAPATTAVTSLHVSSCPIPDMQTPSLSNSSGTADGSNHLNYAGKPLVHHHVSSSTQPSNHSSGPGLVAVPQKASPKRSFTSPTSSEVQPIPPKMARVDSAGNSGAVLASLSQMVGNSLNRGNNQASGDGTVASPVSRLTAAAGGGVQRIVKANAAGDISVNSSPLQNLAVHITPSGGNVTPNSAAALTSKDAAQINMAQILQKMAGVAPVSGAGHGTFTVQVKPQQAATTASALQPTLYPVRQVGGQLLTTSNVPVTVSNGEVKVLPKATLQVGGQTVTVLSPSSAMIQNLRTPANPSASAILCQTNTTAGVPASTTAEDGTPKVLEAVSSAEQKMPQLIATGTSSTPVLKARLEQSVVFTSAATFVPPDSQQERKPSLGDAASLSSNGVMNGLSGVEDCVKRDGVVRNDPEAEKEEEAALNLLTLACQM